MIANFESIWIQKLKYFEVLLLYLPWANGEANGYDTKHTLDLKSHFKMTFCVDCIRCNMTLIQAGLGKRKAEGKDTVKDEAGMKPALQDCRRRRHVLKRAPRARVSTIACAMFAAHAPRNHRLLTLKVLIMLGYQKKCGTNTAGGNANSEARYHQARSPMACERENVL